jgi:hypothetical protein
MVVVYFSNDLQSLYSDKIKNVLTFKKGWQIKFNATKEDLNDIENYSLYNNVFVFDNNEEGRLFYLKNKVSEMEKNGFKYYFEDEYLKYKNKLDEIINMKPELFV